MSLRAVRAAVAEKDSSSCLQRVDSTLVTAAERMRFLVIGLLKTKQRGIRSRRDGLRPMGRRMSLAMRNSIRRLICERQSLPERS
jgi:hypothetical protein